MSDDNVVRISLAGQPPQQPQQQHLPLEAPARVQLAMAYGLNMARRASPMIAVNDTRIDEIQPAKVTALEQAAWDASCVVLADYFNNQLEENDLEIQVTQAIDVEIDRRRPGRIMQCGVCKGQRILTDVHGNRSECGLCEGAGNILVSPYFSKGEDHG